MSTASTSVSKTESPGSNPCAPAILGYACHVQKKSGRVCWNSGGVSIKAEGVSRV